MEGEVTENEIAIQESKEGMDAVVAFALGLITGGVSNIHYNYKNSKRLIRIENELEYINKKRVEIENNLDPLNHIHVAEMIKKIIYTPVSIDQRIKDNFLDVVLYEDYDERIIYEFLLCDSLQYNDIICIVDNLIIEHGAYKLPNRYLTEYKKQLFLNNGYITGAGGSQEAGGGPRNYDYYIITEKGIKFFSLFLKEKITDLTSFTEDQALYSFTKSLMNYNINNSMLDINSFLKSFDKEFSLTKWLEYKIENDNKLTLFKNFTYKVSKVK